jgi:cobalt-zinc-cadmium efflux system protein
VLAIAANFVFVIVEVGYGLVANSVALLADAGHNFGDVIGLIAAWAAVWLGRQPATQKFTYGFKRSSVLAALANAGLLLLACGAIAWEALGRFAAPPEVKASTMMIVAGVGIGVNLAAALLLHTGQRDLNLRSAFAHMMADAAMSAGVVVSGAVILFTGWLWLDPLVTLAIVLVIVVGTWSLFRDSVRMSLDAVPRSVDLAEVAAYLKTCPGVTDIHDLHVWSLSTTETALTAHLVVPEAAHREGYVDVVADTLKSRFSIGHATLQLEIGRCTQGCDPAA